MRDEAEFKNELEIFRKEEEVAQQYFFAWLGFRNHAGRNENVLKLLNETPLLWITTHHALLLASFIALGRVFDQRSKHNIDKLLKMVTQKHTIFTKQALVARKVREGITPQEAVEYVKGKYEPTSADFRGLRSEVAKRRRIYEDRYRNVRDKIFAHNELSDPDDVNALMAKTNIDEMKSVFSFLHALHETLWELLYNGRRPDLNLKSFVLPPDQIPAARQVLPGEMVARDAVAFFHRILAMRESKPNRGE